MPSPTRRRFQPEEALEAQIELFIGLYDAFELSAPPAVRLLNPSCHEEDPVARRFALVEID